MNKKTIMTVAIVLLLSFAVVGLWAATGSLSETRVKISPVKVTYTWTSATNVGGGVATTTTDYLRGKVVRVDFIPGTVGPTGAYTVVMSDTNGVDILQGMGANITSNAVVTKIPGLPISNGTAATNMTFVTVNDILTVTVTNCGASTSGDILIFLSE